jgi:signal recognition particle subunit SRP19
MMDPEKKKWSVIYPVYINSKKTAADGRKIAKVKACENPTAQEIYDVCKHLGFKCELEVQCYLPPPSRKAKNTPSRVCATHSVI